MRGVAARVAGLMLLNALAVRASAVAVLCPTLGSEHKLSIALSVTTEVVTAVGQFL